MDISQMDTDEGGGMCDCGDPEAFSSHFRCDFHNDLLHAPGTEHKVTIVTVTIASRPPTPAVTLLPLLTNFKPCVIEVFEKG